jgi:hypothetical protein
MSKSNSDAPAGRSRREFLAGATFLLTFTIAGCERRLTPAQARQEDVPLRTLDTEAVRTLESLGEVLLPGSAGAGLAHYIDHQLSGDPAGSLLMIKYLRVNPPYRDFYLPGLSAARAASLRKFGKAPAALDVEQRTALLTLMSAGQLEGWQGPPAQLLYFVLRNDAVDVMYGTPAAFETLGVPYMPHIMPPQGWG